MKLNLTFILLITLFAGNKVHSQTVPFNFNPVIFSSGWNEVEGFRFDSTGQMYVWEKAGKVWVVDTNGVKQSTPLLDIHEEVGNWRDNGLNGFVLDPNFRTNGYYYVFYDVDRHYLLHYGTPQYSKSANEYFNATIARVTRYTANPATNFKTTIANSRLVLIGETKQTGIPLLYESHSGGQLAFGTDGSLLVSTGDGATYSNTVPDIGSGNLSYWSQALADSIIRQKENVGAFRSQLVDCLNGKILRVDPANGNGIPSNPYYDSSNPRSPKSRVWSLGLRNPFRMCVRPASGSTSMSSGNPGAIYIGDVGWSSWEDLNIAAGAGMNFGWPLFEGLTPTPDYQSAIVYNYDALNPLYGTGGCTKQYFQFKELCIKDTNTSNPSFPNPCNPSIQIPAGITKFKHRGPAVDWRHDTPQSRTGIFNGGSASQIDLNDPLSPVPGPNFSGNASIGGAWYSGTKYPPAYQSTYFHGDYGQGWIKDFVFNGSDAPVSVADFASGLGPIVFLEYNPKDQLLYYVKYPSDIIKINYTNANNPPHAVASLDNLYGSAPLNVQFTGSNSTDPENGPLTYSWNFGDGFTSTLANPSHTFNPGTSNPVTFNVILTVTDNASLTNTATLKVFANNTPPQVSITSFNNGDLYTMSHNTVLPLQASVYDAQSPNSQLVYAWQTFLHHNTHEHPDPIDNDPVTYTIISPAGCDPPDVYYYRIALTVTDPSGLSTTVTKSIYPICNPPVVNFWADKVSGCSGTKIHFTNQTTNLPDSWLWSFPGGSPSSSTSMTPSGIIYNNPGTYSVTLSATNSRGTGSLTKTGYIVINSTPLAVINPPGPDSICSGTSVTLFATVTSGATYQWVKNGSNISGATSPSYIAASGNYKIKVTGSGGCSATSLVTSVVNRPSINKNVTASGSTTFCNSDSVTLSAAYVAGYSYKWKRNGDFISGAVSWQYVAKTRGTYKVTVTDAAGCSKASSGVIVTVNCKSESDENFTDAGFFEMSLHPNPVTSKAELSFFMPAQSSVSIRMFNAIGEQVAQVADNIKVNKGENNFTIDASGFPDGIYLLQVLTSQASQSFKFIIDKNQ